MIFITNTVLCITLDTLKSIHKHEPVLLAPHFAKEFKLAVDDSDTDAGGVLLQDDSNGVIHPLCVFPKKIASIRKTTLL